MSSAESLELGGLALRARMNQNKTKGDKAGRKGLANCIEQDFQAYSNIPDKGKDSETKHYPAGTAHQYLKFLRLQEC